MASFVPLPSADDLLTEVGSTSAPMFETLLPLGLLEAGLIIGALVVVFLIIAIPNALGNAIGHLHGGNKKYE